MRWKDENDLGTNWLKNFEKIKIELSKIVYCPFPDFGMHRYFWNDLWPGHFHYVSHYHSPGHFRSGHFIPGHFHRESIRLQNQGSTFTLGKMLVKKRLGKSKSIPVLYFVMIELICLLLGISLLFPPLWMVGLLASGEKVWREWTPGL